MKTRELLFPVEWEHPVEALSIKAVIRGSDEWNIAVGRVHKSLPSAKVMKLERIQNQWLWERYAFSMERLSEKNHCVVHEEWLFHGTGSTSPEDIFLSEYGFDFRLSRPDRLWGAGVYFAVNASYSDKYAHQCAQNQTKKLLLARVLTGETFHCKPDRSLKRPPMKPLALFQHYDSVCGHTNGSNIYIIYDHEKAYPAYLITYALEDVQ